MSLDRAVAIAEVVFLTVFVVVVERWRRRGPR